MHGTERVLLEQVINVHFDFFSFIGHLCLSQPSLEGEKEKKGHSSSRRILIFIFGIYLGMLTDAKIRRSFFYSRAARGPPFSVVYSGYLLFLLDFPFPVFTLPFSISKK